MFSKDNLPPIVNEIDQDYLSCTIVRDFGKGRLNGIFKIEQEIDNCYKLKDYDGAGHKQRDILECFDYYIENKDYGWRSREHEIEHWINKTSYYIKSCYGYKKDYILSLDRHNGCTIEWIIKNDFDYIVYCMETIDKFFIDGYYLIDLCNSGYFFNSQTIVKYRVKRIELVAHIKVHHAASIAQEACNSPYLNYDSDEDDGWGGNSSSNPYYDDDSDMDQQSQEFWDNL